MSAQYVVIVWFEAGGIAGTAGPYLSHGGATADAERFADRVGYRATVEKTLYADELTDLLDRFDQQRSP